jgi:polyisoprenoid-binding protein YceI
MTVTTTTDLPGLVTGTWTIDTSHSDVSFTVRHLMVSKVRGHFAQFAGEITIADDPLSSSVTATVELASIDTRDPGRDDHLRSADFFEVSTYPTMTYRSTAVVPTGSGYLVEGELSLHGVTRPVALDLELNGVSGDPWGGQRAGFSATAEISRKDFGIEFNIPMDGGGVVVGDKIQIALEIEAILQADKDA